MDRVGILCEKDSEMMHEFSRRSLHGMQRGSLFSATLSFFSSYLDGNIRKEVDKDRLIIEEAAAAFAAGRPACDLDLEDIFEKTKTVDSAFLDSLTIPSFAITVRYSDFADIRIQRIWLIARTVYTILGRWTGSATFCDAVRAAYPEEKFRAILLEILHLYNLETRMLGDSIRSPFNRAIVTYLESLFESMESVMQEMATGYARTIYGDKPVHA
ncbi:MAG TPA: hypothetical protein VL197_00520 [Nitrospirota bacterium]|nr:hypothetical protein [Nitrospirota bacterium]